MSPRPLLLALLAVLCLTGCGYRPPGALAPSRMQRLHVAAFANNTFRPGINAVVAGAVLRRLQLDHRLAVVDEAGADAVLAATVRQYENEAVAFEEAEIGRRFRVRLFVAATLVDRRGGPTMRQEVVGEAFYTAGGGVTGARAAEEDAARRAARDVADRLVTLLIYEMAAGMWQAGENGPPMSFLASSAKET
jgi:hypothetical protein